MEILTNARRSDLRNYKPPKLQLQPKTEKTLVLLVIPVVYPLLAVPPPLPFLELRRICKNMKIYLVCR